ncbi:MAG: cysteine desulfurase, partial [Alphaproteobacteria bacterium CG_4_10_14_0_8_um_filter_53_9]
AVGAVLASPALLATLPPWQGGGDMIERVSFSGTTYADGVARFEAGTPAIAEVIALGAACDWVSEIGFDTICAHEAAVASLVDEALDEASVVRYGPHGTGIFAFNVKDIHPSDVAMVLDNCGVAVRTGHHCAMPLMEALGIEGCVRASVALYNDETDVERLRAGLAKVTKLLS